MKYIDIHSHLNLSPLLETQDEVISRMKECEVTTITVGTELATSIEAIRIAEKNEGFFATVGIHPNHADASSVLSEVEGKEEWNEELRELAKNKKVVAIGECGLDYFRNENEESKNRQKEIFKKHIELAIEVGKPLMIHARPSKGSVDAYEDALSILEAYSSKLTPNSLRANFHFFVGNTDIAKRALEGGHTMSFDGPITFSGDYDEVIKFLPLDSIMAETDAPYATPAPHRGNPSAGVKTRVCEPWMVEEVYKAIARIKGLDDEEVREKIMSNSKAFFDIKA